MATCDITGIAKAGVAKNLSFAQITFNHSRGEPFTCRFSLPLLERVSIAISDMIQHVRGRKIAHGRNPAVSAIDVDRSAATEAVGGGRVLVSFRAVNGILYVFGLSPEQSAQLRGEMQRAEASALHERWQTRQ